MQFSVYVIVQVLSLISPTPYLVSPGLERLPPPLLRKEGLETLDLSFNDLHTDALIFPPCLSSLTDLRLWRCKLTELDPSISSMQLLQKLNLEENRLRLLPDSLCKLRRLQTLRLSENLLCALPRRFGFLNALSDLHLDGNVLEALPSSFSRLVSLKSLSLARNRLVAIDESLLELRNLEHLNLESNEIAFLPDAMGMLRCKSILLAMNRCEGTHISHRRRRSCTPCMQHYRVELSINTIEWSIKICYLCDAGSSFWTRTSCSPTCATPSRRCALPGTTSSSCRSTSSRYLS